MNGLAQLNEPYNTILSTPRNAHAQRIGDHMNVLWQKQQNHNLNHDSNKYNTDKLNNYCPISPSVSSLSCNSPVNENRTQNDFNIEKNNETEDDTAKMKLRMKIKSPQKVPLTTTSTTKTVNKIPTIILPLIPKIMSLPVPEHCHPKTGFVHCLLLREYVDPGPNPLNPYRRHRYTLHFQKRSDALPPSSTIGLVAERAPPPKTSYHIFDVTRGAPSGGSFKKRKFNKKQGCYVGKLKKVSGIKKNVSYLLMKASKNEAAGMKFEIPPLSRQLRDGQPPRKLRVVVPSTGSDDSSCKASDKGGALAWLESDTGGVTKGLRVFETRDPSYDGGQYRLNFNGRVTVPSVKNMQVLDGGNGYGGLALQFGRIGENRFHLDYKAPLNAFQAFGMALAQFDL